jgi:hypothetical protein
MCRRPTLPWQQKQLRCAFVLRLYSVFSCRVVGRSPDSDGLRACSL